MSEERIAESGWLIAVAILTLTAGFCLISPPSHAGGVVVNRAQWSAAWTLQGNNSARPYLPLPSLRGSCLDLHGPYNTSSVVRCELNFTNGYTWSPGLRGGPILFPLAYSINAPFVVVGYGPFSVGNQTNQSRTSLSIVMPSDSGTYGIEGVVYFAEFLSR